ncbi:EEP domain-containing protein [Hydrogenovibrio sp. SC-1]|uniref:endonuclease/exonuclease/phosphatase family protein n=1 Tax=Hydrogenovibrio sp. SC-1 TaxID=2065820 RepID=UPI000C7C350F|nr:endonuclease/exonuclease/phosphatase family protein [Hydrogenovibrio sp. SC-1]PLA73933.1 EEP domain-containing protein [Hydrogenovibrio sp. SC-1]
MYKPKLTPLSIPSATARFLPNPFRLIVWNCHKVNFDRHHHQPIEKLLNIPAPQILSLQEATLTPEQPHFFQLPYIMTPNIQTTKNLYGVLTASSHHFYPLRQQLTKSRELGFLTYKASLITLHPLSSGEILTHLNIHAINFVPHLLFKREIEAIRALLEQLTGPMILSGDFNTWNKKRVATLFNSMGALGLKRVTYPDERPIKTLNRQPLDYIFYRGLEIDSAQAMRVPNISDHNPLIVDFKLNQ